MAGPARKVWLVRKRTLSYTPRMRALASCFSISVLLLGCAPEVDDPTLEDADVGESELASTISETLGPLKLTVQSRAKFEERDGRSVLVISGSANRNLENVFSFVPDDGFGQASLLTARKFELVLSEGYEINTILSGLPILMSVQTATGTPNSFVSQIKIAPSFGHFTGSSKIFVKAPIRPVFVKDQQSNLRYRGDVKVTGGAVGMSVFTDDGGDPSVRRIDADDFDFDWTFDGWRLAADPATEPVYFVADRETGADLQKKAKIDVLVTSLAITTDDPYIVWQESCDMDVWHCFHDAPADQVDFGACGSYRDVKRCEHFTPGE